MLNEGGEAEAQVFISYSRRDFAFAQWLVDALNAKDFAAYLDKVDIAPGEPWKDRLAALILASDTVVFIVSASSVASEVCAWELNESARLEKRIFPVVAERIPEASAPPGLGRLNWIFCAEGDDRDGAVDRLGDALRTDLPWIREHTRLAGLAGRWHSQSRAKALMLRGSDLRGAEDWLGRRPAELATPTDLHREFIRASRRAATLRNRWVSGAAAVIVALSLALAGWAEINRREAQLQRDVATEQRIEAETQRDRADEARKSAEVQRDRAEKALASVADVIGSLYMATSSLADLLVSEPASDKTQSAVLMRQLVEVGDVLVNIVRHQEIVDRSLDYLRSLSLEHVAKFFFKGDDKPFALRLAERSVEAARAMLASETNDGQAIHLLSEVLQTLAIIRWTAGDTQGAGDAYDEALKVLVDSKLNDTLSRRYLGYALLRLGYFHIVTMEREKGERELRAALALFCQQAQRVASEDQPQAQRDIVVITQFIASNSNFTASCDS